MSVAFEVFESYEESWEGLFHRAAELAGRLDPRLLIKISHSESVRWSTMRPRCSRGTSGVTVNTS
jgi:hypothetical protein